MENKFVTATLSIGWVVEALVPRFASKTSRTFFRDFSVEQTTQRKSGVEYQPLVLL